MIVGQNNEGAARRSVSVTSTSGMALIRVSHIGLAQGDFLGAAVDDNAAHGQVLKQVRGQRATHVPRRPET